MNPKISIIIPVYNVEKYIKRCLDSIINQTLKELEIICIDDGSTDGSGQILDEYSQNDSRIKVIHKQSEGQGIARNIGLEYATGEYIGFVDSDDWIEPETYECAISKMTEDIDVVFYGIDIVLEDSVDEQTQSIQDLKRYYSSCNTTYIGEVELNDDIIFKSTVNIWNKLYKASIIKENQLYFPDIITSEDIMFFYEYMLLCKKAYYIEKCFYNYFQRAGSLMHTFFSKKSLRVKDELLATYHFYRYLNKKNILEKHSQLFIDFFKERLRTSYEYSLEDKKQETLNTAIDISSKMDSETKGSIAFLRQLRIAVQLMVILETSPRIDIDY